MGHDIATSCANSLICTTQPLASQGCAESINNWLTRYELSLRLFSLLLALLFSSGCPQMTWGRTLENALASKGISKEFKEWIAIAKDRPKWRQQTHSKPKPPDA